MKSVLEDLADILELFELSREMERSKPSKKFNPRTFADFVTLVVPKVGQESAPWKYDVRKDVGKLTVYGLKYEDDVAVITDCLCLEFCSEPSKPSSYHLIPTYSLYGRKAESTFVRNVIGKSFVTSPAEVGFLLDYLDDQHRKTLWHNKAHSHFLSATEEFSTFDEELSTAQEIQKSGCDNEISFSPIRRSLSQQKRLSDGTSKRKKTDENVQEKSTSEMKLKRKKMEQKRLRKSSVQTRNLDSDLSVITSEKAFAIIRDVPSLPLHSESGGTIFSSQYWTSAAASRERLMCAKDIFVEVDVLNALPKLSEMSSDEVFAQSVTYGWLLLEHLLGGSRVIQHSFAYSSSDTSPITRNDLIEYAEKLCGGILGWSMVVNVKIYTE